MHVCEGGVLYFYRVNNHFGRENVRQVTLVADRYEIKKNLQLSVVSYFGLSK